MDAPWEVYQKHMEVFPYGLPLWDPSPVVVQPSPTIAATLHPSPYPLEIIPGSVLYPVPWGRFDILFNSMKQGSDHYWQPRGVPKGFQTLEEFAGPGPSRPYGPTVLRDLKGVMGHNVTIKTSGSAEASATLPVGSPIPVSIGGGFELRSQESSGALLATVDNPISTSIQLGPRVRSYILAHHAQWKEMALLDYDLEIRDEDLYFVLGTIKTTRWLIASYVGAVDVDREGHLHCTISNVFDLSGDVTVAHHEGRTPTIQWYPSRGGATTPMAKDQCIFIHFAKLKRRTGVERSLDKVRALFGQSSEARDNDLSTAVSRQSGAQHSASQSSVNKGWDVEIYPSRQRLQDAVDVLLDYVLEEQPDVDVAMASSLDVVELFKDTGIPRTEDLRMTLAALKPLVLVDIDTNIRVGTLQIPDTSASHTVEQADSIDTGSLQVTPSPTVSEHVVRDIDGYGAQSPRQRHPNEDLIDYLPHIHGGTIATTSMSPSRSSTFTESAAEQGISGHVDLVTLNNFKALIESRDVQDGSLLAIKNLHNTTRYFAQAFDQIRMSLRFHSEDYRRKDGIALQLCPEWDALHQRFYAILDTSRDNATEAAAFMRQYTVTMLQDIEESDYQTLKDKLANFTEMLAAREENAGQAKMEFGKLADDVRDFGTNINPDLEAVNARLKEQNDATQHRIADLHVRLQQISDDMSKRAALHIASFATAALGVGLAVVTLSPEAFMLAISAVALEHSASALIKLVREKNDVKRQMQTFASLLPQQEDRYYTGKLVQVQSDMKELSPKIDIFVNIWSTLKQDLHSFNDQLGNEVNSKMRITELVQKKIANTRGLYKTLIVLLEEYAKGSIDRDHEEQ